MPTVIALIVGIALCLVLAINLLWALILLVPFYAYMAIAVF